MNSVSCIFHSDIGDFFFLEVMVHGPMSVRRCLMCHFLSSQESATTQ